MVVGIDRRNECGSYACEVDANDDIRILYLAGFGRSGSSILGNVIGQIDGWFHGGEIRNLWNDGWISDHRCGCGKSFWECPIWSAVAEQLQSSVPQLDPRAVVAARDSVARTRHLAFWFNGDLRERQVAKAAWLREILSVTYATIARVTRRSVIVDSTMSPAYAFLLSSIPGVSITIVHLVRDPRAVAFSWHSQSLQDEVSGVPMRRYSIRASTFRWVVENLAAERIESTGASTSLRIRYEDFVDRPSDTVRSIAEAMGTEESALPEWEGSSLFIRPTHTVWGNPSRFVTGRVEIRGDRRWEAEMAEVERSAVERIAGRLMRGYGYI